MTGHELLFRYNQGLAGPWPGPAAPALEFEAKWISSLLADVEAAEQAREPVRTLADFKARLTTQLTEDGGTSSGEAEFISQSATREQFQVILREYALDGLTEAEAMFAIIPRLDPSSQSPVMRILIDEFGCGNPAKVHSHLYRELLTELELPTRLEPHLEQGRCEQSYAFVNVYHWLTKRAVSVDYYLGALAYTERVIPDSFQCYVQACERLGIRHHEYFSEHVHIDAYHARDAFLALQRRAQAVGVDFHHAWLGVQLARRAGNEAFSAIVRKASGAKPCFELSLDGRRYAVPRTCPHRGGDLSKGHLHEGGKAITCPLHGATFALPSGRRLGGPACADLRLEDTGAEEGA